jgi:hypothetical protein
MSEVLDDFGNVVTGARDGALDRLEQLIDGRAKAPGLQHLVQKLRALSGADQDLVREVVRESIDDAFHGLLFNLYMDERIALTFDRADLKAVSDGFHGDYLTEEGWLGRFSKHPHS